MIKLYGIAVSNYFCSAKAAFIEKNIPFEEVAVFPSQKEDVLCVSPMGKVPWVEVDGSVLTETNVIYDYLEDISPEPNLYPQNSWERAKVKELIRTVELYFDAPARRHVGAVYFGQEVEPIAEKEVLPAVKNGLRALMRLGKFSPYIGGDTFTFADITAYFQLRFTQMHMMKIYDWDMIGSTPLLSNYIDFVGRRDSLSNLNEIMQAGFKDLASR
jgi:glutathione S-transferase